MGVFPDETFNKIIKFLTFHHPTETLRLKQVALVVWVPLTKNSFMSLLRFQVKVKGAYK